MSCAKAEREHSVKELAASIELVQQKGYKDRLNSRVKEEKIMYKRLQKKAPHRILLKSHAQDF